jgi:hypothetical protein
MVKFSGPAFATTDNRLLALHLVRHGLTNAVMFSPTGEVLQPSEALYKKAVLVERGSFRPVTHVNVDMLNAASAQFHQESALRGRDTVVLMEITMNNLLSSGSLDIDDFLSRVDMLGHIGFTTLISNYSEYYRLVSYFRRYTKEMVGIAVGLNTLIEIFNEKYYDDLEGGILEAMGRLFRHDLRIYAYPMQQAAYEHYVAARDAVPAPARVSANPAVTEVLITARNLQITPHLRTLYAHLLENRKIEPITGYNPELFNVLSREIYQRLRRGESGWEEFVPPRVAAYIKERGLFGWKSSTPPVERAVA